MTNTNTKELICTHCGKPIPANIRFKTSCKFIPLGYLPYCLDCLCELVDMRNIAEVDKLFQYANWPLNPSKWLLLCKGNLEPQTIFHTYYKSSILPLYKDGYAEKVDWKLVNDTWANIIEKGELAKQLSPEEQKAYEDKLREFWEVDLGDNQYSLPQLEYLQKLYDDIERTQNVSTGAQADQAKKLARLSLAMDIAQRNNELELYAKLMTAYTNLVKIAEFTPKSSQSNSSFESVGELVAFLEKTGFINKFYDGEQRDIVDKTIKNQQIFLRRLVSGESNLSERIEQRLQRMNILDRMEDGTTSEEEWSYDLHHDDDYLENYDDEYTDESEHEELDIGEEDDA